MSLCISELKSANIPPILESDLGDGVLYLLPSTMAILRLLPEVMKKHEKIKVVGDINFIRTHGVEIQCDNICLPPNFLKICKECNQHSKKPPSVLVFTDQLVSPEFSPILVRRKGVLEFFSCLECIAVYSYGMSIRNLASAENSSLHGYSINSNKDVLNELSSYFDICSQYEEGWVAAGLQVMRTPRQRIILAKRRLRTYMSVAMASCSLASLGDDTNRLVSHIFDARDKLRKIEQIN